MDTFSAGKYSVFFDCVYTDDLEVIKSHNYSNQGFTLYLEKRFENAGDSNRYYAARSIFMQKLNRILELSQIRPFLEHHRDAYEGITADYLVCLHDLFVNAPERYHGHKFQLAYNWSKEQLRLMEQGAFDTPPPIEKLKWNGSASHLGWLFLELERTGFVEPPSNGGQISYKQYAHTCLQLFELDAKERTVIDAFNPNSNALKQHNRAMFTIPELSDIANKKNPKS